MDWVEDVLPIQIFDPSPLDRRTCASCGGRLPGIHGYLNLSGQDFSSSSRHCGGGHCGSGDVFEALLVGCGGGSSEDDCEDCGWSLVASASAGRRECARRPPVVSPGAGKVQAQGCHSKHIADVASEFPFPIPERAPEVRPSACQCGHCGCGQRSWV
jgi:hypothetical protein